MDIEIRTWPYDNLNAITEIDSFFEDQPREFLTYDNDMRTRRAIDEVCCYVGSFLI